MSLCSISTNDSFSVYLGLAVTTEIASAAISVVARAARIFLLDNCIDLNLIRANGR